MSARTLVRSTVTRTAASVLMIIAVTTGLISCSTGTTTTPAAPAGSGPSSPALTGEITVLAAASLTESFTTIGTAFTATHPGTKVTFSFGSSATLATQVTSGAPADVFAAANETTMDTVEQAGLAVGRTDFVSNQLEIAVPAGNPGKITGLADFADADKKVVLCARQVPCGSAAVKVFEAAGITPEPDSYEADVKAALSKVTPLGSSGQAEADAALVYRTDVKAGGTKIEGIEFPEAGQAINVYPIAGLKDSANPALASAFVAYVLSPDGQKVLTAAGFGSP